MSCKKNQWNVMVDLSGTIHIESSCIPGAVEALSRLREQPVNVKFVTNTTKESRRVLFDRLRMLGFEVQPSEIFTSLLAAKKVIDAERLRPYLLLEDAAMEDFAGVVADEPYSCVVVGLAPSRFDYSHMNEAFNILLSNPEAELIAIHMARYFRGKDGLALGPGPFASALAYATDRKIRSVGKPEASFFRDSMADFGEVDMNQTFMIGDDSRDDIGGAQNIGAKGILVKTGKYRAGDEFKIDPPPWRIADDICEAVKIITDCISSQK